MSELRPVPSMSDRSAVPERDLEAETAHRIRLLVARTRAWRKGSFTPKVEAEPGVETAAS